MRIRVGVVVMFLAFLLVACARFLLDTRQLHPGVTLPSSTGPVRVVTAPPRVVDARLIVAPSQQPRTFEPFDTSSVLHWPGRDRSLAPDEQIELSNGNRMSIADYVRSINELERGLNAVGYSLRDATPFPDLMLARDDGLLNAQASAAARRHTTAAAQIAGHRALMSLPRVVGDPRGIHDTLRAAGAAQEVAAFSSIPVDYDFGDSSTFAVSLHARLDPLDRSDALGMHATHHISGSLLGIPIDVASSDTTVTIPGLAGYYPTSPAQVSARLDVAGNDTHSLTPPARSCILNVSDGFIPKIPGIVWPIKIPILGPIYFDGKIGFRGEGGWSSGFFMSPSCDATDARAEQRINYFADISVFAQAGVGIGPVSVGAGGELNLIRLDLALFSGMRRTQQPDGTVKAEWAYDVTDELHVLSGDLYVSGCIDLWIFSKCANLTLWSWPGMQIGGAVATATETKAACKTQCAAKSCNVPDGCGGTCSCTSSARCVSNQCCTPSCPTDGSCGQNDGCGGTCGCSGRQQCLDGSCCAPVCVPGSCGQPNGCGGTCDCPPGAECGDGRCKCRGDDCCARGTHYCECIETCTSPAACARACKL